MTYFGKLASELRYKNYPEDEVRAIVAEARLHTEASGLDAESEFGENDYPARKPGNTFKRVTNVAYALVLAGWIACLVLRLVVGPDQWPPLFVLHLGTVAGLMLVGLVAYRYSHRLPAVPA